MTHEKTTRTRPGTWLQTHSGRQFYPLDIRDDDIDIGDIAHALSMVCRFTGHVRSFYSVAQHCVLVAKRVGVLTGSLNAARAGLLYDASEAYLADVSRPVKGLDGLAGYLAIEAHVEQAIAERFGLRYPWQDEIKRADVEALATEKRDLIAVQRDDWGWLPEPWPRAIESWEPARAEREFLAAFAVYGGQP